MSEIEIAPTVIMPNRIFLVGVLYGFNAGRRAIEKEPQPYFNGHEATNEDVYLGSWFEVTCNKCQRLYTYDDPNDIPENNLICETEDCRNHIIFYGVMDPRQWRCGKIKFI